MSGYGEPGRERKRDEDKCRRCRSRLHTPVPSRLCEFCRMGAALRCVECRAGFDGDETGDNRCKSCRLQERLF